MAAKTVFGKILESATKHGPENECNWTITQLQEGKEPDYILQELPDLIVCLHAQGYLLKL